MPTGTLNYGTPVAISSSKNVLPTDGAMLGIFCSSSSSGTCTIYDSATTGTGTTIVAVFNLTAGTWYELPITCANGFYIVLGGTAAITAVVAS
ncbi:MAG: hypothetical protein ACH344_08710 [Yersinia sp. (in: enterobacteria)]|jgi:hypothetical protein